MTSDNGYRPPRLAGLTLVMAISTPPLPVTTPVVYAEEVAVEETEQESFDLGIMEYVSVRESFLPSSNTIATKLPVPLHLTPAHVGAVGELLLREQDAVLLGDALLNVSGVNVQPGSGVHDYFLLRGFDSLSSGLIMTDGAAEPEVSRYHLYNVQGVEVFKGPAGFLYGSNPLAGVVNIVRKQPASTNFLELRGSAGSFQSYEGSLDWNLSNLEGRSFRLNGVWLESDGFRDGQESRHLALNPSFRWQLDERSELTVNLEYVDAEYQPDSGIPLWGNELPDVPRETSYQSALDFSEQTVARFQVDYSRGLADSAELRVKAYYRELDWQTDGTLINGVLPNFRTFAPEVSRTLTRLDDRQRLAGAQIETILHLEHGSIRHELLAGVELARLTDEFTLGVELFLENLDLFDPVESENPLLFPLPSQGSAGDAESRIVAPYLVDQIRFTERFQLLLGMRWDEISFEDPVNDIDRDDSELSPMLGLVFAPRPNLTLYANAGRSHAPASPRVIGERVPERSTQIELGLKKQLEPSRLQATLALYQLDRENIAIPDDTGFTQQTGDQRSRGVELEIAAEPWEGGRIFFNYAYNDAELTRFREIAVIGFDPATGQPVFGPVDRSGNRPAFAPEQLARLWLAHSFAGGWRVGGGVRYIGDQFIAEDNAYEIPGEVVVDATVSYGLGDWRLQLNLKNLTDEEILTRGFASTSVIPAPGFAASLGFECSVW